MEAHKSSRWTMVRLFPMDMLQSVLVLVEEEGSTGGGEVYNVYQATDYEGVPYRMSVLALAVMCQSAGLISGQPLPGQNGSASFTAGASTLGVSGSLQEYWIIDATAPTSRISGQQQDVRAKWLAASSRWDRVSTAFSAHVWSIFYWFFDRQITTMTAILALAVVIVCAAVIYNLWLFDCLARWGVNDNTTGSSGNAMENRQAF